MVQLRQPVLAARTEVVSMVVLAIPAELVAQKVVVAVLFVEAALLQLAEEEPAVLVALVPAGRALVELAVLLPGAFAELVALPQAEETALALQVVQVQVQVRERLMAAPECFEGLVA